MTCLRPAARTVLLTACAVIPLLPTAPPATAADVVEPWGEGLSNVELFGTVGEGLERAESTAAVGLGLPGGFSVGLTLAAATGTPAEAGFVLVYSRSLGRLGELDLWGEVLPVGQEVELLGARRALGMEWSGSTRGGVPYARLTLTDDGEARHLHPLLGWMLPVGDRMELHLELSGEEPDAGSWPLHLAVGPNWRLSPAVELLPELSMVWQPDNGDGAGGASFFFTLGICLDPTAAGSRPGER